MSAENIVYAHPDGAEIVVGNGLLTACTAEGIAISMPIGPDGLAALGAALLEHSTLIRLISRLRLSTGIWRTAACPVPSCTLQMTTLMAQGWLTGPTATGRPCWLAVSAALGRLQSSAQWPGRSAGVQCKVARYGARLICCCAASGTGCSMG